MKKVYITFINILKNIGVFSRTKSQEELLAQLQITLL